MFAYRNLSQAKPLDRQTVEGNGVRAGGVQES